MNRGWVLLAFALAGCSAPTTFSKSDVNAGAWRRDTYECERDARQSMPQTVPAIAVLIGSPQREFDAFYRRCMEARGYTATTK